MIKEFLVKAKDVYEAEKKAIEMCADDPEALMPHNMEVEIALSDLPESFFNKHN